MKPILTLKDKDNGISNIKLIDLLELLEIDKAEFKWSIQNLTAVVMPGSKINVLQLEKEAEDFPKGKLVSANDLLKISKDIDQIIDGLFIAYDCDEKLGKVSDLESAMQFASIAIEYFDSSSVRFFSKENDYIEKIRNKYPNSIIDPSKPTSSNEHANKTCS
jgi:hypothetical protein